TERVETDFSFADVLMSIDARANWGFGIVEVDRGEARESDHTIELTKSLLHASVGADLVAGREDVGSVEANAEALRLADVLYNISDLLEPVTEARALAGRCLERDLRFHFRDLAEDAIDRVDDLFEPGFFAGAEMRTRMQNQKRQLELVGAR